MAEGLTREDMERCAYAKVAYRLHWYAHPPAGLLIDMGLLGCAGSCFSSKLVSRQRRTSAPTAAMRRSLSDLMHMHHATLLDR